MATMNISSFEDLLLAARAQLQPQRLLFVFAGAGLPDEASPEQRSRFESGSGGTLIPLMSVDKAPEELGAFPDLVEESLRFGPDWAVVFVAGLAGRGGRAPTGGETDRALQRMVEAVRSGSFGSYLPFDRTGNTVVIN